MNTNQLREVADWADKLDKQNFISAKETQDFFEAIQPKLSKLLDVVEAAQKTLASHPSCADALEADMVLYRAIKALEE